MISETPTAQANERTSVPEKFKPRYGKHHPKHKVLRRRPRDIYSESMLFMGLGLREIEVSGESPNILVLTDTLRKYFRNYCINNRIRGKQKASMERIVHAQIRLIKVKMSHAVKTAAA